MSTARNIWFLEDVDLYKILCPHKTPGMEDRHPTGLYKKDEFIYFPNQASDRVYLVAHGKVKIGSYTEDGKETMKAILSAGEIFGEMALIGEEKRGDFAQSLQDDTSVCVMNIEDLEEMMYDNRALSLKIYKIIGLRIKKLERKVESLVFKDSRTRVIDFIRELAEEKGKKVGFETMVKNYLTHKDIANLTGTSRQTVTTILNELKEKNVINFNRRQFLIRDMELLK